MSRSRAVILPLLFVIVATMTLPSTMQAQPVPTGGQTSFSNLIAALNNIESEIRTIENQSVEAIEFANIREMRADLDESQNQTLDEEIEAAYTETLHDFLDNSTLFQTAFQEKRRDKVNVEDVVAVDMLSDGTVVVYFDPTL